MAQFTCKVCGDGFEQKSRFERHMATSHPEKAPSAADIEKALSGIQYPRTKEEVVNYASGRLSEEEIMNIIKSFPTREYRDSAEVAIALGEVKRKQGIRSAEEVAKTQRQVQRAEGRQPPHHQFQPLQLPRFFQEQTFQRIKVNSEIMRKNI